MHEWNAVGLFCDDIREENRTLVGIFPDRLAFSTLPAVLPKMGIYVRVNVNANAEARDISVRLRWSGGEHNLGHFPSDFVRNAQLEILTAELPLAGFVVTAMASPMQFNAPEQFLLLVRFGDEERICGNMLIVQSEAQAIATAPQPSA